MDGEGVLSKLAIDLGAGRSHSKVAAKALAEKMCVPSWAVGVDRTGSCVAAPVFLARAVAKAVPQARVSMVKEYPTALRERFRVYSS